jgi:hypothetical protein
MTDAFEAFTNEIIDYAGMFPPARLDLESAFRRYTQDRRGPYGRMLGRFIVSPPHLSDLARLAADSSLRAGLPVNLRLILGGAAEPEAALETARVDIEAVRTAVAAHRHALLADAFEIRFPHEAAENGEWGPFLAGVRRLLEGAGLRGVELFAELPPVPDWQQKDRAAVEGITAFVADHPDDPVLRRTGVKLRCGGPEPDDFPPVSRIAGILADCRDHHVPVKFTAGLHHPVRFRDDELDVEQHGFLNVFGAGVLAWSLDLARAELTGILGEMESGAFRFDGERFLWRDRAVTAAQVERGRAMLVTAFGSCSIDEPVADLKTLGMLE